MTQIAKFEAFAAMHVPGDPVVLFNVWDVGSAQAVARAGARAIATGSASVAGAAGFGDGEQVPLELALANARQIVASVDLPITVDFEGGYAAEPEALAANAERLAATGVIGCNFEDQIVGSDALYDVEVQCRRIAALRGATGDSFFINARTDLFLKADRAAHDSALTDHAIERGAAYAQAGASGFFVPGLVDLELVERICRAVELPVNVMHFPAAPGRAEWTAAGVARISHGPFPFRAMQRWLEQEARAALT